MTGARLNVDDIVAGLRAVDVLNTFGAKYQDEPQIRLKECPRCGMKSRREAIVINRETGAWIHHGGAGGEDAICKGDVLELVAAFAGLDRKRDFVKVLEVAAPIAGVVPGLSDADRERMHERRRAELAAQARDRAERRAAAEAELPARWETLDRRSLVGERYLANRGIAPAELIARDVVRFEANGDPAVRLFSFADGTPINILRRQIDGEPKVLATADCSTDGSIIGRVTEIDPNGVDVAVLVEGMTDSLAAVLAFPGCAILGANGAGKMEAVAAAAAPRLRAANGWLLVTPDVDDAGVAGATDAVRAAIRAGMVLDQTIRLVDVRPAKDLAQAWATGWRWSWK